MRELFETIGIAIRSARRIKSGFKLNFYLTDFNAVRAILSAMLYSSIPGNVWSQANAPGFEGQVVLSNFLFLGSEKQVDDQLRSLLRCLVCSLVQIGEISDFQSRELYDQIELFNSSDWEQKL